MPMGFREHTFLLLPYIRYSLLVTSYAPGPGPPGPGESAGGITCSCASTTERRATPARGMRPGERGVRRVLSGDPHKSGERKREGPEELRELAAPALSDCTTPPTRIRARERAGQGNGVVNADPPYIVGALLVPRKSRSPDKESRPPVDLEVYSRSLWNRGTSISLARWAARRLFSRMPLKNSTNS